MAFGRNPRTMITGRLAPSPTGAQHLGNARTYLIAWLSAKSQRGRVILRIEDIDSPRVKSWAADQAIEDLRWLGLDWDEGPDVGGPHAPYLQTDRADSYLQALQGLIESGQTYPCTCSRRDIEEAASAPHEASLKDFLAASGFREPTAPAGFGNPLANLPADGPIYSGRCQGWRLGDALPPTGTYCWRFRMPDRLLEIEDRVHGSVRINPKTALGDFPLTRKTGHAAYQLAVVVDDAAMGVTEVVRGDDLLPSVFRQVPLIEALGCPRPQYAHVPLVLGTDGRRLAKRHGDTRLSHFRTLGITPQEIVGWAAHCSGLSETAEPVSPHDLVASFDWERILRTPTTVDSEITFRDRR